MFVEYEYASAGNYGFSPNVKEARDYILKNTKALGPDFIYAANALLVRWEKMK
jgi:hypothetical protein